MASTLLAVDDSVTMRKVLEITFAGPDFRVVTASSPDAALQKIKAEKIDLVIADISLEPKNGYDLCKALKQASPGTPVLLLSSKQNAYDAGKGSGAQADDHIDKPFDTQQMIDKVKKLVAAGGATAAAPAPAPAPAKAASAQTTPSLQSPIAATRPQPPAAHTIVNAPPVAPEASPMQRAKTLIYNPPAGPAAGGRTAPTPVSPGVTKPEQTLPAGPAATAPSHATTAVSAQLTSQLSGKLDQLGLTPAQADAVLALSREVIERVVWEVVPVLAETMIKEEIARLTK